jgi:hypothetical protein
VETMATVIFGGPLSLVACSAAVLATVGSTTSALCCDRAQHTRTGPGCRDFGVGAGADGDAQYRRLAVSYFAARDGLTYLLRGCRRGCRRRRLPCRRCQRKVDPLQAEAVWLGVGCHLLAHALLAPWQPCTRVGHAWQLHVPPDNRHARASAACVLMNLGLCS